MALRCPACGDVVRAEHVDVALNDATCPHCREPFRPSCALPPASELAASRLGLLKVEHPPEGGLRVHIAPAGLRGVAVGLLGIALLWNLVMIPVFAGFLVGVVQGDAPWAEMLFLLPFLIIGVAVAHTGCRLAWSRTTLWLDRDGLAIVRELFGHQRGRAFRLDEVKGFSRAVGYKQNKRPIFVCQARAGRKRFNFGHRLSESDQEWLVDELNRVLADLRN